MKLIHYFVIAILCSFTVFAAELSGDCSFRVAVDDVSDPYSDIIDNPCSQGELIVGYAGLANHGDGGYHFFHEFLTIYDTIDGEKGWVDTAICCPGTGLAYDTSCSGSETVFYGDDADTGGTHVELNNVQQRDYSYSKSVCLANDGSEMNCEYTQGTCSEGYYCIAKVQTGEDTNLHISNCNDNNFGTRICCSVTSAGECGSEGDECQANNGCCNADQNYCSFGLATNQNYPLIPGHCCLQGEYWNTFRQECAETETCGYGENQICNVDPGDNWENFIEWATNDACVNGQTGVSCCPNVDVYGDGGNYMIPIIYYDGQP